MRRYVPLSPPVSAYPGCAFLPVTGIAGLPGLRLYFKIFKLPKLGVGIAIKMLLGWLLPRPMLINKRHRPSVNSIVFDALIVFFIVQLIEIARDLPVLSPGQLHGVSRIGSRVCSL